MTEEVIIDLKLDQDEGAFAKLAQIKGSLVSLKQEQANLTKAYKDGNITLKEFSSESVRVEALMKKQADTYSKVQRSVTGLKSPFDKLNESIKAQAQQVNVAGISLATFANPVTATVGILGGLFAAYGKTTAGAKDLEFASNQLSAASTLLGNSLTSLFTSAEDGQGLFTNITNGILGYFSPSLAAATKGMAMVKEELEDLAREEIKVRAQNNQRLQENAELNEKLADSTVSLDQKRKAATQSVTNLRINEAELLKIKERELKILEAQFAVDSKNEALEDLVALKTAEISALKKDTERAVSKIDKMESNILDTENKKLETIKKQNEAKLAKDSENEMERQIKQDQKEEEEETQRILELQQLREANSTASYQAWWNERVRIATEANEEMDRKAVLEFEKDKARQVKKVESIKMLTTDITTILTQGLQNNVATGEQILKSYLIMAARALKTFLITKAVGESLTTWDSILTFGISGAVRGAVIAGLIEAAFAGIESVISGFATGGVVSGTKIKDGKRIQRSNGDDVLITAKRGEVILNERQQRALGGDRTFARLGVPGFAMGGLVTSPSTSFGADSEMLKRMLREISKRQVAVVIEDVERLQQTRAQIVEQATL